MLIMINVYVSFFKKQNLRVVCGRVARDCGDRLLLPLLHCGSVVCCAEVSGMVIYSNILICLWASALWKCAGVCMLWLRCRLLLPLLHCGSMVCCAEVSGMVIYTNILICLWASAQVCENVLVCMLWLLILHKFFKIKLLFYVCLWAALHSAQVWRYVLGVYIVIAVISYFFLCVTCGLLHWSIWYDYILWFLVYNISCSAWVTSLRKCAVCCDYFRCFYIYFFNTKIDVLKLICAVSFVHKKKLSNSVCRRWHRMCSICCVCWCWWLTFSRSAR